jgi:hypothetical protein
MQNERVTGSWILPSIFQSKTQKVRQCVVGSVTL